MAGVREVRCVGPSAPLADKRASVQRLVNLYLSATESPGEDKQYVLRKCPGFSDTEDTVLSGELRGMCGDGEGKILFIDGNTVKELTVSDSSVDSYTGTLSSSSGRCRMALGSGSKVVIVDGSAGYVADMAAQSVTAIADADFSDNPSQVAYLDGYWIVNDVSAGLTDQFFISAVDDPTAWDALDFSSADRLPDGITAIHVSRQELYLFGRYSTEIWYNSGGVDFPFSRYTQAPIDVGIAGPDAVVNTSGGPVFVGRQGKGGPLMVFKMEGHNPRRISTRAVEESMKLFASGNVLTVWSYSTQGAEFVGIDGYPAINATPTTWVYDLSNGEWHERDINRGGGSLDAIGVCTEAGLPYIGLLGTDGSTYKIYPWRDTVYVHGNTALDWSRTWPHLIAPSHEPVRYASLELLCTTGSGSACTVSLEVSNDGGETFGSAQSITISTTDKEQRVRWYPLGQARDRVFRISGSSDAPLNIYGAQVETT